MYKNYAVLKGWQSEVLTINESAVDGLREASLLIKGEQAFRYLKFESGVHRVQRVPDTETLGRVHTSTMTVAVMPEADEMTAVELRSQDMRIETKRASGAGGQHVNTTDSAVRITHLPTGIVVAIQDERSQHMNKAKALKILKSKLYEMERQRKQAKANSLRKKQIGTGDRSERIRTYNFPQDRITDHRVGLSRHGMDSMLAGEFLDSFSEALEEQMNQEAIADALDD